jgi:dehydrogenase/reductase SDR family protein 12
LYNIKLNICCESFLNYRGGYESASKHFNPADLDLNVDCSEKSYMITGGNSGIGKCIALDIAKRGGTVHLVCRNKKSAQEAQTEIKKASGNNVKIDSF